MVVSNLGTNNMIERFLEKISVSHNNFYQGTFCWKWIGGTNPKGYGRFWLNGKTEYPHRVLYEYFKDSISGSGAK